MLKRLLRSLPEKEPLLEDQSSKKNIEKETVYDGYHGLPRVVKQIVIGYLFKGEVLNQNVRFEDQKILNDQQLALLPIYKNNHLNPDVLDVEIKQAAEEPSKFVGSHGCITERLYCLIPDLADECAEKWDEECVPNCSCCCCTIPANICACPINAALGIAGLFADAAILGHKKYQQHVKQQEIQKEIDKIFPPLQQAMR